MSDDDGADELQPSSRMADEVSPSHQEPAFPHSHVNRISTDEVQYIAAALNIPVGCIQSPPDGAISSYQRLAVAIIPRDTLISHPLYAPHLLTIQKMTCNDKRISEWNRADVHPSPQRHGIHDVWRACLNAAPRCTLFLPVWIILPPHPSEKEKITAALQCDAAGPEGYQAVLRSFGANAAVAMRLGHEAREPTIVAPVCTIEAHGTTIALVYPHVDVLNDAPAISSWIMHGKTTGGAQGHFHDAHKTAHTHDTTAKDAVGEYRIDLFREREAVLERMHRMLASIVRADVAIAMSSDVRDIESIGIPAHRDIKHGNISVDGSAIRIMDFSEVCSSDPHGGITCRRPDYRTRYLGYYLGSAEDHIIARDVSAAIGMILHAAHPTHGSVGSMAITHATRAVPGDHTWVTTGMTSDDIAHQIVPQDILCQVKRLGEKNMLYGWGRDSIVHWAGLTYVTEKGPGIWNADDGLTRPGFRRGMTAWCTMIAAICAGMTIRQAMAYGALRAMIDPWDIGSPMSIMMDGGAPMAGSSAGNHADTFIRIARCLSLLLHDTQRTAPHDADLGMAINRSLTAAHRHDVHMTDAVMPAMAAQCIQAGMAIACPMHHDAATASAYDTALVDRVVAMLQQHIQQCNSASNVLRQADRHRHVHMLHMAKRLTMGAWLIGSLVSRSSTRLLPCDAFSDTRLYWMLVAAATGYESCIADMDAMLTRHASRMDANRPTPHDIINEAATILAPYPTVAQAISMVIYVAISRCHPHDPGNDACKTVHAQTAAGSCASWPEPDIRRRLLTETAAMAPAFGRETSDAWIAELMAVTQLTEKPSSRSGWPTLSIWYRQAQMVAAALERMPCAPPTTSCPLPTPHDHLATTITGSAPLTTDPKWFHAPLHVMRVPVQGAITSTERERIVALGALLVTGVAWTTLSQASRHDNGVSLWLGIAVIVIHMVAIRTSIHLHPLVAASVFYLAAATAMVPIEIAIGMAAAWMTAVLIWWRVAPQTIQPFRFNRGPLLAWMGVQSIVAVGAAILCMVWSSIPMESLHDGILSGTASSVRAVEVLLPNLWWIMADNDTGARAWQQAAYASGPPSSLSLTLVAMGVIISALTAIAWMMSSTAQRSMSIGTRCVIAGALVVGSTMHPAWSGMMHRSIAATVASKARYEHEVFANDHRQPGEPISAVAPMILEPLTWSDQWRLLLGSNPWKPSRSNH